MTECIYGMLKRRFPILKYIRVKLGNAVKIAQACAVLHNMALDWADPVPARNHPVQRVVVVPEHPPPDDIEDVPADQLVVLNALNPRQRRMQGVLARDNWRSAMTQVPTEAEIGRMANHRVEAQIRRNARAHR